METPLVPRNEYLHRARSALVDLPGVLDLEELARGSNHYLKGDLLTAVAGRRNLIGRIVLQTIVQIVQSLEDHDPSGQAEELHLDRLFPPGAFPEPFDGYREALRGRIERLVVSHRPDPGPEGQLLKETAYGLVDDDGYNLVFRKPITELTPNDIAGRTASRVRDGGLRSPVNTEMSLM